MSLLGQPISELFNTSALLCLCAVYFLIKYRTRAIGTAPRKDPNFQDVSGLPLLGILPRAAYHSKDGLEWAATLRIKHGPGWSCTFPGLRLIDISKPEWIEYVQKTNFSNYVKGHMFRDIMSDVFGEGIFVTDGARWKSTRQCTSRIFNVNSFKNIVMPSLDESLQSLNAMLQHKANRRLEVDFCSIFYKFTLESFVKMTFGKELDVLKAEMYPDMHLDSSAIAFAEAFDVAQNHLDWRFSIVAGWSIVEKIVPSLGKRVANACKTLDNYTYKLIDERANKGDKNDDRPEDLLELFMKAEDEKGTPLDRTQLKDALLNMLIAGRDTTAQALSWAFFHLIMNPGMIDRVREEISEMDRGAESGIVTYDNYRQFVWTQAVLCEALRLHPSVPKNMKMAVKHDQIPNGPVIQPGDAVRWGDWAMGRDHDIWGPDCGEFKPTRWIDSEGKLKQFGPFKFHAFNGGPRLCLGINLAMLEAISVIVEIVRNFDIEFSPGWLKSVPKSKPLQGVKSSYPTPSYKSSLTLPMAQPMLIRVQKRKKA
ncbi:cytochrome P450 monooxygenase [Melampsora larici-populina 98AG31]|uniref:Cytochrome P450 monooxygenase n=1 Tax=Melampsora larici-populina (strain 98AG31 / pathotype 3-4-7) TaxID=747676 RepID=F4R972_MELLP|nr:cytochrome P450 monooxygenase [Melampsora larici-populina 98AG31]EGG11203.1 cytochrome P450 monooxygenase [Melampsora larici-populina 98AG31]